MVTRFIKAPFNKLGGVANAFAALLRSIFWKITHPRKHRAIKLEMRNRDFLRKIGFEEIDNGDLSYIDGESNALRVVQTNQNQITFIVIGKRRSRAYLKMDKKGRYTEYTGPIKV